VTDEEKSSEDKPETTMEGLKDARTFLRNVLPGLAIVIEFVFFAWTFQLFNTEQWAKATAVWTSLTGEPSAAAIAGVVTLFFASGAAGYIVSNLYHFVLNRFPGFQFFDYHRLLQSLTSSGRLKVTGFKESTKADEEIRFDNRQCCKGESRRNWAIVTAIWAERRDKIKAATERSESLVNVAHGAGTLFVGSLIAWVLAFLWWACADKDWKQWSWSYLLWNLIGPIIVIIHYVSLRWTALVARDFIAIIISNCTFRDFLIFPTGRVGD
jgi:hypothetical protein